MLEGRRGRKPQSLLQLFHERVRIQRVEEVDVTRSAEQNCGVGAASDGEKMTRGSERQPHTFERQLSVCDEGLSGLLVGVGPVS